MAMNVLVSFFTHGLVCCASICMPAIHRHLHASVRAYHRHSIMVSAQPALHKGNHRQPSLGLTPLTVTAGHTWSLSATLLFVTWRAPDMCAATPKADSSVAGTPLSDKCMLFDVRVRDGLLGLW